MPALGLIVGKKMKNKAHKIPPRYPSGRKKPIPKEPNVFVIAHRIYDNWSELKRLGYNEDFGSAIGKMYMFGYITAREATAGRIYAQTAARYDRFNGIARQAKSPAYMRASRGHDDTVDKIERAGTVLQYEKSARRARNNWHKIFNHIPNPQAHKLLDEVCIYDIYPVDARSRADVKTLLGVIASKFGIKHEDE